MGMVLGPEWGERTRFKSWSLAQISTGCSCHVAAAANSDERRLVKLGSAGAAPLPSPLQRGERLDRLRRQSHRRLASASLIRARRGARKSLWWRAPLEKSNPKPELANDDLRSGDDRRVVDTDIARPGERRHPTPRRAPKPGEGRKQTSEADQGGERRASQARRPRPAG